MYSNSAMRGREPLPLVQLTTLGVVSAWGLGEAVALANRAQLEHHHGATRLAAEEQSRAFVALGIGILALIVGWYLLWASLRKP